MIDFWELSGRLLLMDPAKRDADIYTDILPIQTDGCISLGNCNTALIAFSVPLFYNQLRDYFTNTYTGQNKLLSPVISMFTLGEIGTMFFNQKFRNLFNDVSSYLLKDSVIKGRSDIGSAPFFYMMLMLLASDRTTRASVANDGNFLGLAPADHGDQEALKQLAINNEFITTTEAMCLEGGWSEGSISTLRHQKYGTVEKPIDFRHFRFGPPL